jgi:hypothetical protein
MTAYIAVNRNWSRSMSDELRQAIKTWREQNRVFIYDNPDWLQLILDAAEATLPKVERRCGTCKHMEKGGEFRVQCKFLFQGDYVPTWAELGAPARCQDLNSGKDCATWEAKDTDG